MCVLQTHQYLNLERVIHPLVSHRIYHKYAVLTVLLQHRLRLSVHQVLLDDLNDLAEVLQSIPVYKFPYHLQDVIH